MTAEHPGKDKGRTVLSWLSISILMDVLDVDDIGSSKPASGLVVWGAVPRITPEPR